MHGLIASAGLANFLTSGRLVFANHLSNVRRLLRNAGIEQRQQRASPVMIRDADKDQGDSWSDRGANGISVIGLAK
jgi:hypothetical protein